MYASRGRLALRNARRIASLAFVNAWSSSDAHRRRCFAIGTGLLGHAGIEANIHAQSGIFYLFQGLPHRQKAVIRNDASRPAHIQAQKNLLKRIDALLSFNVSDRLSQAPVAAARDYVLDRSTSSGSRSIIYA
jgi:aminoacrylate hydrolase